MQLSDLDRRILNILQNGFPICAQPYAVLADIIGIDEELLLERVAFLKECGIIRRIGGVMNAPSLGYYSTLCACQVPVDKLEAAARVISSEKGVTHNYRREHRLNLWFTLTAPSRQEADETLSRLEEEIGVPIYAMPALKTYKIHLSLPMGDAADAD